MGTTQQPDPHRYQPLSPVEAIERDASFAELAVGAGLRGVEIAAGTLLALLLCPPLFILVVIVAMPVVVIGALALVVTAVLIAPYELVRHLRGHQRSHHATVALHRLRRAAHAVADVLPHRLWAATRRG